MYKRPVKTTKHGAHDFMSHMCNQQIADFN